MNPDLVGTYVGESKKQQSPASKSINRPDSGPGKDKVDQTEAKRRKKGMQIVGAGILEDSAGVKGDNVDSTHLLRNHDNERRSSGTANTGDAEQVEEAADVV